MLARKKAAYGEYHEVKDSMPRNNNRTARASRRYIPKILPDLQRLVSDTAGYDKKNTFDIEKYLDRRAKLKQTDVFDVVSVS